MTLVFSTFAWEKPTGQTGPATSLITQWLCFRMEICVLNLITSRQQVKLEKHYCNASGFLTSICDKFYCQLQRFPDQIWRRKKWNPQHVQRKKLATRLTIILIQQAKHGGKRSNCATVTRQTTRAQCFGLCQSAVLPLLHRLWKPILPMTGKQTSSQPIMLKNVKLGILYYPKTNLYSTDMKIYFKYLYVTKSLSSPGRYIFAWYLEIPVFRSIVFDG